MRSIAIFDTEDPRQETLLKVLIASEDVLIVSIHTAGCSRDVNGIPCHWVTVVYLQMGKEAI